MSWQAKSPTPPPGYHYGPRYRPSALTVARTILYILLGRQRSLSLDTLIALREIPASPQVRGLDRVPEHGPLVVVANHYERPGLWMAWPAIYVSHLLRERTGRELHWVAIQEWESFDILGLAVPPAITRAVFQRAFRTYGIIGLPPPGASTVDRAGALRETARRVTAGGIVGLMPEGDVGPTPELLEAREGVGALLLALASRGAEIIPTGLYEEDGRLVAAFGDAIDLFPVKERARSEQDAAARLVVMRAIRDLLPCPLWGAYREHE